MKDSKKDFVLYLETINRQIKDIEKLVNEFSDFARMPSPLLKKIKILHVIDRALKFYELSHKEVAFNLKNNAGKNIFINGDNEQLYRVFVNLIKNSIEAIEEMKQKDHNLQGKITVEIDKNNEYIVIKIG